MRYYCRERTRPYQEMIRLGQPGPHKPASGLRSLSRPGGVYRLIFLQFVVQGSQAKPQDLRRAGLVVLRVLESAQNGKDGDSTA